jgi:hypothetical protein
MEDVMKDTSSIPADLASLLADLPPESLRVLEEFARFLHEQARQGRVIQPVQEEKNGALSVSNGRNACFYAG